MRKNMIYHKHLLVNAKVKDPINTEQQGIDFLTNLVEQIDMKIIKGPFASYVDKDGNRGLTAIVMIETSHIAFHIWDEVDPALIQFDLYTCGQLELNKVINLFKQTFNLIEMDYVLFDREHGFVVEQQGEERNGVFHTVYPNGRELNPEELNPNIGGYLGKK
ncbi:S-adenosylmethionine decarboxylase [bacterium]|nr:S-adenosylmethionine decarboxylase [bacterium]